jgi:hypothetical protein
VFDALVHGQDAHVARAGQTTVSEERREVAQRRVVAVGVGVDAVDEIGAGQVQKRALDRGRGVVQQRGGVLAQQLDDLVDGR